MMSELSFKASARSTFFERVPVLYGTGEGRIQDLAGWGRVKVFGTTSGIGHSTINLH